MNSIEIEKIKSLRKGQSFFINEVEYVFIKNVDADSIVAGDRVSGKQEQINLTFLDINSNQILTNKNKKTMTNENVVSVREEVEAMNVKDLRKEASSLLIVGYSKMKKVDLQARVIEAKEAAIEAARPKTEVEVAEEKVADLNAKIKIEKTLKKAATESDQIAFHQSTINDFNAELKEVKAELVELKKPAKVEKEKGNKPSKAQIAKDKKVKEKADAKVKTKKEKADAKEKKEKENDAAKVAAKKAKGLTTAEELDKLISKGGTWKSLSKKAQAIGDARGQKTQYSKGTFKAHIKFRETQNSGKFLKGFNIKMTDEGIVKNKK